MIRESLYFSFDGRKSTEYGIKSVSVSSGLFDEPFLANRSIKEYKIRGREEPYLVEVEREPKSFQLSFLFPDRWNEAKINEIASWLDVNSYRPLFFEGNLDRIFYALPTDSTSLIHNGLKQGYLTLNMRCNSPYAFGREVSQSKTFLEPVNYFEFQNKGDLDILPEITIEKIGDGDVYITNLGKLKNEFILTDLKDKEKIYMHGEKEIIESNRKDATPYDNFNDNYIIFHQGRNLFEIRGNCRLTFRYHFKYRF